MQKICRLGHDKAGEDHLNKGFLILPISSPPPRRKVKPHGSYFSGHLIGPIEIKAPFEIKAQVFPSKQS